MKRGIKLICTFENNFKIKSYENTFKLVDLTDHYFFIL